MTNNPFLKSKESNKPENSRFCFLDDEDSNNKPAFKEPSNRKHTQYEVSQNSFTQSFKPNIDRDQSYRFNNRRQDNFRGFKHREPSPPPHIPIEINNIDMFPELCTKKENTVGNEVSTNFKDILTNIIEDIKSTVNTVPPGWTRMSLLNGKTIVEHGPPTPWMIKQQQKEQLAKQQHEDPTYIMIKVIEAMKKNWDRYEREYDELHGEGTYSERFILPPVYGPEYDTETEIDDCYYDDSSDYDN